jgi:hypothetical protein
MQLKVLPLMGMNAKFVGTDACDGNWCAMGIALLLHACLLATWRNRHTIITMCIQVLNELAFASEDVACRILGRGEDSGGWSDLLVDLMATVQHIEQDVQCSALLALSTLAFPRANKVKILQTEGYLSLLKTLAAKKPDMDASETKVSTQHFPLTCA